MQRILFVSFVAILTGATLARIACDAGQVRGGPVGMTDEPTESAIRALLTAQGQAWNRGDLDGYLSGFWHDPSTRQIFNDVEIVGFEAIEARLRARYAGAPDMGTISFSDLEVVALGPDGAVATAAWSFAHGDTKLLGRFTLVLRKVDGRWLIVHDHSSAYPAE